MSSITPARQKIRLGDLLVQHKVIAEHQLQQALAEQKKSGRKLGRVLIELGFITEDQLLQFLAQQLGAQLVDLRHFQFRPEVVRMLPETHARRYRTIVLNQGRDGVLVGMADPTDIFAYDELTRILKKNVKIALVREADLLRAIDIVYRRTEEISTLAEELGQELMAGDFDLATLVETEGVVDAPVIKLLQSMFEDAVQVGASDIHIEPDEAVLRIRQRVDGVLHEQVIEGKRVASALVTRLKLMSQLDISEKRLPQDGRFTIRVKDRTIDVRVSTMPIQHGESIVMRLLDQSATLMELESLGMPAVMLPAYQRLAARPSGMLLVTGPTGSGKTTTLYATLARINDARTKIITVEDPVEYRLARINQVQIVPKIGLDFARVLRSALRQDPDVIMVGEMRDRETAEIGLRAAMTGHLVLSTLHTNDAVSTVTRMLDMGAQGYMLAAALNGVLAQRLVRRNCEYCVQDETPDHHQRAWLASEIGIEAADTFHGRRGEGCAYCNNTGYRGRIGVYELLEIDEPLADALRRGDAEGFVRLARERPAFRRLVRHAIDVAARGVTSVDEAMRLSGSVEELID